MREKENKIQQDCVIWFRNNNLKNDNIIFSVPNETNNQRELMVKKSIGLLSGVSDLIVILPNRIVFVEMKTPTGKQSETQAKFENAVKNLGFEYFIVKSLEEFKKIILHL